jgi:hypothetical protein
MTFFGRVYIARLPLVLLTFIHSFTFSSAPSEDSVVLIFTPCQVLGLLVFPTHHALRHDASWKIAGSRPDEVDFF